MKENQDKIYYACGENNDKVDNMPQVELIKEKGYEILYLTDYVDEFAIMAIHEYKGKTFVNVTNESTDLSTDEEVLPEPSKPFDEEEDDFDDEDEEPSLDDLEFPDDIDDMEGEGEE